ncbi:efflux RND transporter periplasmic adaptor subunit [Celeribacter indicus]|uniref:RND family efflux transporter MFP subunit n=1 Tax=Celeribacter indicus TaxID=1208324 RepID=A0A0B5E313_9RHOB|nr:efflux RND transporter periplasmic adaptor subunit [Celeribacter indicus]AJE47775.1 RND family efflux transporter MFP subunit [Celeribacter indicus]SDW22486.1 membrane fusion protein, multidrug efflux system [Celeribacter indicus]
MQTAFPAPLSVLPRRFAAAAAVVLAAALGAQAQEEQPPMPVTVVTLQSQSVTLTAPLPGRVAASAVAEVRPQVNGIIRERLFDEGSHVEENAPLYQIDAASYEAARAAAEASLAQARATLNSAQIAYNRQEELRTRNVIAQQNLDAAIAERDTAAAGVKVAEANLQAAEIDLDRTTIRAPIAGITGLSDVTQGALVTSGQQTALTTIRALDPVYVDVTQSAADILRWRRLSIAEATLDQGEEYDVSLTLADGSVYEETGKLSAAEPHVREDTGTVLLRLSFPNPEGFLLPGMYVQVEMPQGVIEDAILVPQEAVSRDRRGVPTVFVVNDENVVESRTLTVERDQGTNWIVTDGVAPGERVIVAGLQKTAPGATVTPQERTPAEAEEAATGGDAPADAQDAPAEAAPAEDAPAQDAPADEAPAEDAN